MAAPFTKEYITLRYHPQTPLTPETFREVVRLLEGYLQRMEGRIEVLQDAVTPLVGPAALTTGPPETRTKITPLQVYFSNLPAGNVGAGWYDGLVQTALFWLVVPSDYTAGDIVFHLLRRSGVATGTAHMTLDVVRLRDAASFSSIVSVLDVSFTPGDLDSHLLTYRVPATTFRVGDVLRLAVTRDGTAAGDTLASVVAYDGAWAASPW